MSSAILDVFKNKNNCCLNSNCFVIVIENILRGACGGGGGGGGGRGGGGGGSWGSGSV